MKTEKEIQDRLAEIKIQQNYHIDQVSTHRNAVSVLNTEKNHLQLELYQLNGGFKIGDEVKFMDGKIENKGRVTGFDVYHNDVSPVVSLYKADGKLGTRTTSSWRGYKFEKI